MDRIFFSTPAYACIFAQDTRSHTHRKKPITFLWEHEGSVLEDPFFESVLSTARSLVCNEFFGYNSGPEDYHTGGFKLFRRFMDSRDAHIRISAPRLDNWETGLHIIRSWKVGEVLCGVTKNTSLGRQLGQMTRESLSDSQASAFYAANALRCLVNEVENGGVGFRREWLVPVPPDRGWA